MKKLGAFVERIALRSGRCGVMKWESRVIEIPDNPTRIWTFPGLGVEIALVKRSKQSAPKAVKMPKISKSTAVKALSWCLMDKLFICLYE